MLSKQEVEVENSSTPKSNSDMKDEYNFDYERFTNDYYEYEQGQKHIIVKGRLKKNLHFWKELNASNFVLDLIELVIKVLFTLCLQEVL